MKKLSQLSLALLCCVFACEKDSQEDVAQRFVYNTNQLVLNTESFVIDFENFNAGDIVSEIPITDPFENAQVSGITMAFPNSNAAMIFDSSNPTGGDFDIGTPNELYGGPGIGQGGASNDTALGNVLILSENLNSNDPDDIFELGARFLFDFSTNDAVILNSFDILDIEESQNPTIVTLFDADNSILFSQEISPGGDNSKTTVDLEDTSNVAFMEIIMNSSGAVDNIALQLVTEEPCVACDSSITELTFRYIGGLQEAPIRFETPSGDVVFNSTVGLDQELTLSSDVLDGSFGNEFIIFVNNTEEITFFTDCSQIIGPGSLLAGLEVISGTTETGGQLCPVQVAF
jgi:hypothetical protein